MHLLFLPPSPSEMRQGTSTQLRSFGMRDWDVALMKRFPITERLSFSLKGEFFNALNTVNFGAPKSDIHNPSFGKITSINGNPRNGQISGTVSW